MSSKKKTATPYHAKSTKKSAPERATERLRKEAFAVVEANLARIDAAEKGQKPSKDAKPTKPAKAPKEPKAKKLSALDAAAQVLAKAKDPMNAKALIETMAEQKLWTTPGGKTPHATLYAAMLREINEKGKEARFKKADRGLFTHA